MVDVGQKAPDFTLATLGGNFQLSEHRGEVMLLYFSFPESVKILVAKMPDTPTARTRAKPTTQIRRLLLDPG